MTDAIVKAAARAVRRKSDYALSGEAAQRIATAVLTAVTPLIEAAALERAAKAMDRDDWSTWEEVVAAVTRALKEQP